MKPVYFENLSSHYFVMKVVNESGEALMEKRRWNIEEGESQFNKFLETDPYPEDMYQWLCVRSELIAMAEPTKRWTDREWTPVEKISRFKRVIDNAVAASRARRNSNFLRQIFSGEAQ